MGHPELIHAVADEAAQEYLRARQNHAPMRGAHEGYAVLLEEVDELWDLVKLNPDKIEGGEEWRKAKMRKEAIQIAAMALAFINEVCDA